MTRPRPSPGRWMISAVVLFNICAIASVSSHISRDYRTQAQALKAKFPQPEKSGWQIVGSEDDPSPLDTEAEPESERRTDLRARNATGSLAKVDGKSIDWDDDDPNGENHNRNSLRDLSYSLLVDSERKSPNSEQRRRSTGGKLNRLVFHGRVSKNGTTKVVDGIKLRIDSHKPVAISRRSHSSPLVSNVLTSSDSPPWSGPEFEQPKEYRRTTADADKWLQSLESSTSSEWRPVAKSVSPTQVRRVGKTGSSDRHSNDKLKDKIELDKTKARTKSRSLNDTLIRMDFKWKPVTKSEEVNLRVKKPQTVNKSSSDEFAIVYGKKPVDELNHKASSPLADPFDTDDLIIGIRGRAATPTAKSPNSNADKSSTLLKTDDSNDRWRPLDMITTTLAPTATATADDLTTTTTTVQPTTTLAPPTSSVSNSSRSSWMPSSSGSGNNAEQAQRSASDVNYIYSSQPQAQGPTSSSGSYYSNYVMTPSQQPVEQPAGPIIDTTSGQVPEMIADRTPETAPVVQSDYSMPQSVASFQPMPTPARVPVYASNYDYSSSYGAQQAQRVPQAQAPQYQPQPTRQSPTQAPQVVRQEHHYHYYNQQQQQQSRQQFNDNNQQFDRSQPSNGNQNQQTVIREIQPLLISQPIVQQAPSSSTTQAPQIIREIVKEVPVQTMQVQPVQVSRVIIPQPSTLSVAQPPINIPTIQTIREVEASPLQFAYAPAQRIIRTISNSMPQVAVRMPALPQLRFPVATLPLPVRLATSSAPVTRQTGTFVIPPMPKKTTTFLTETQAMPTHTTIMQTTQFTPATRTTVYTTDHQTGPQTLAASTSTGYRRRK